MTFEEAMNIISEVIDYYYNEFYDCRDTEEEEEEFKQLEKAESAMYLLVKTLKEKGITNLKEAKELEKVKFVVAAFN